MTNLKLSSKMHIMIIVSAIVVAIGLAMGLIFHFIGDGYFNYGSEYSDYNCVVVEYAFIDYSDSADIKEVCDDAFKNAKVSYYSSVNSDNTNDGGQWIFKFSKSVNPENIQTAVNTIHSALNGENSSNLSSASYHEVNALLGNAKALKFGAIALSAAVVFQFIYFAIRYKLTMAFSALLADVHNLAIFVSLLAITRLPVGISAVAFGALTVLATMIGCCFLFDKIRKNAKEESIASLGAFEQTDRGAGESFANVAVSSVCIAAIALVLFVLMSISAMSLSLVITPVVLAVLCAVSSIYGTSFFTPSVYSRIKRIGDNFKADRSKKTAKNS